MLSTAPQTHSASLDDHVTLPCELVVPFGYDVASYSDWAKFLVEQDGWPQGQGCVESLAPLPGDVRDFMAGFLSLLGKMAQLGRMPVFDPIRVTALETLDPQVQRYRFQICIPAVHHLDLNAYWHVVNASIDLSRWIAIHPPTPPNRDLAWKAVTQEIMAPLHKIVPGGKSTIPVLQAAHQLGIPLFHLGLGSYQLGWGSKSRRMSRSMTGADSQIGSNLAQNKVVTANVLRAAGLPAPEHAVVSTSQEAITAATRLGFPIVVKPTNMDRGEGVTVDVMDTDALIKAFAYAQQRTKSKPVIVERQVLGVCHRLFVVCGQLLYAVKRMPMGVFGDGQQTVAQLVRHQLLAESEKPPWSRSEIQPIDDLAMAALSQAKRSPDTIAGHREFVALRRIESTQWGGVDVDVTTIVHPENISAALEAAKLFGLQVAGIDMISSDISQPWHANLAIINEVNSAPLLGGAEISRSYLPAFFAALMEGDGKIPIEIFQTEGQAREFQKQQSMQGRQCYLTWATKTVDGLGADVAMPFKQLAQRVRALVLRHEVDAIAIVGPLG